MAVASQLENLRKTATALVEKCLFDNPYTLTDWKHKQYLYGDDPKRLSTELRVHALGLCIGLPEQVSALYSLACKQVDWDTLAERLIEHDDSTRYFNHHHHADNTLCRLRECLDNLRQFGDESNPQTKLLRDWYVAQYSKAAARFESLEQRRKNRAYNQKKSKAT